MPPLITRYKKTLRVDLILACLSFIIPFIIHWRLLTPNLVDRLYIDQDVTISIHPALLHLSAIVQRGEFPLWNWHIYSGMYEGGAFYNHLLYPVFFPFLMGWFDLTNSTVFNIYLLLHLGIGAVGMYLLARSLKFHPLLSLLGSCVYSSTYISSLSLVTGGALLMPLAWLPVVLISWRGFALGKSPRWALLGGVAWFFCLLSANPIAIVPIGSLVLFWLAFWGRKGQKLGLVTWSYFLGWIVLALILAGGLWVGQALPLWESISVAARNTTANFEWARMGWREQKGFWTLIRDFLLPHYPGSPLSVVSLGATGSVLFVIAIWIVRDGWERYLAWFTLIIAAVLFLPDALIIYDFAYLLVPLVDRSNAIDRGAVAFILPAILVSLGGVRLLLRHPHKASLSYGYFALVVLIGYAIVYGLSAARFNYNGMTSGRLLTLVAHMALFMTATLVTLRLMVQRSTYIRSGKYLLALAIIVFLDVSALARDQFKAYVPAESIKNTGRGGYLPVPYGVQLNINQPSIASPRVNLQRNHEAMLISEDNVVGYYQFQPRWVTQAIISADFKDDYLRRGPNPFDMDVKWPKDVVEKIYDIGDARNGRAYPVFTGSAQAVTEALKTMASTEFNPLQHLVYQDWSEALKEYPRMLQWIYSRAPLYPTPQIDGNLQTPRVLNPETRLVAQSPSGASFLVRTDSDFFFFSNSWHPGWLAFVDGVRVPVLRANYAFMAVNLPRGPRRDIRVDFIFRPTPYYVGLAISCVFVMFWLGIFYWVGSPLSFARKQASNDSATKDTR